MPNVPFAITDGSLTFLGTRAMRRERDEKKKKWSGKDWRRGDSRKGAEDWIKQGKGEIR